MKRFRVTWTKRAVKTLNRQFDHIAKDNLLNASSQRDRIVSAVSQLYTFPSRGRPGRMGRHPGAYHTALGNRLSRYRRACRSATCPSRTSEMAIIQDRPSRPVTRAIP